MAVKETNKNSGSLQVGISSECQWQRAVMKGPLQGPIVIYFSGVCDAIRARCSVSKASLYGFL